MDPDANLKEQRQLAAAIIEEFNRDGRVNPFDGGRLADLVKALDDWIRGGGFLPSSWQS